VAHAMFCAGQLHRTTITNGSDKQERLFTDTVHRQKMNQLTRCNLPPSSDLESHAPN